MSQELSALTRLSVHPASPVLLRCYQETTLVTVVSQEDLGIAALFLPACSRRGLVRSLSQCREFGLSELTHTFPHVTAGKNYCLASRLSSFGVLPDVGGPSNQVVSLPRDRNRPPANVVVNEVN